MSECGSVCAQCAGIFTWHFSKINVVFNAHSGLPISQFNNNFIFSEVMKIIEWGPDSSKLFSKTGCKRLGPKVALLVDRYYRHASFSEKKDEL